MNWLVLVLVVKCVVYKAIGLSVHTFHFSHFYFDLFFEKSHVGPNCCMWCVEMFYGCVLIFLEMAGIFMRI